MIFKRHLNLEGQHAYLGASQHAWLRYSDDKLIDTLLKAKAAEQGTILHAWACETIKLGLKQSDDRQTINMYINDAIGYKMTPEVLLYYSENCFGTADAICFRDGVLRIHDLKTGTTRVHMDQLKIYAALFCLEYDVKPADIQIELRIYQSNNVVIHKPGTSEIVPIMDKIQHCDKIIKQFKAQEV